MNLKTMRITLYVPLLALLLLFGNIICFAERKEIPPKPAQERLVNDFAHVMTASEVDELEQKLDAFAANNSTQITIVTIDDLGDYEIADFATDLGKSWGVGRSGKDNGIVLLAAINNRKINISTGKGIEGALPDILCGRIIQNEIAPSFKLQHYYEGFSKGADAIIAATKNEYKADDQDEQNQPGNVPKGVIVVVIIFVIFIIFLSRRGGGNNRGGGIGNFATGMLLGNMLGGGFGGGGRDSGGGSGGFGGFGGGGFGGGGASGSW